MNKASNKFYEHGRIETHYVIGNADMALCGCDLAGDDGYKALGITEKRKVNCPQCLEIYRECVRHFVGKMIF